MYNIIHTHIVNIPANISLNPASTVEENVVGETVHRVVEPTGNQTLGDEKKGLDPESQSVSSHQATDHEAYPAPTEEERTTLRKVYDTIPLTAWTLCIVEVGERAS